MALGAMDKYDISVTLISCGFNYFHPEQFRSKVIMEYGHPFVVSK
jgi:glycerol-3-phosphate O-acyltransferase/dihydroxyacetone phosphate acyltransferase